MPGNADKSSIELLITRRSMVAAKMTEPGPNDAELNTIIEAGLRVPDHGRIGPWRIQIIRKEAQEKLGELFGELFKKDNPDAPDDLVEFNRARPSRAPILLAITFHPDSERYAKVPHSEQILSVGACCQNLLNGAHALGYVAQWLTEWPAYHSEVKKALGHDADTEIAGFIYIGSAAEAPEERQRVPAENVISEWTG
ncbi:MAG: nitroreductase [Rhodospirillales bacterium]|nr:nitroreductase [Rhodospirillales bacterium]